MLPPVPSYDDLDCPLPLRRHQREAIEAVQAAREQGSDRWWVTLPPGAGKTLVGTEVARLTGRRTVVLSPNTAIQGQWQRAWDSYGGPPSGNRRDLRLGFTSLTYQALAVFEEREPAEPGSDEADGHLDRLHENGRALVETMRGAGPLLVVLDECHHLLEVWGELLREVLALLPDAVVLGLTATPPGSMSRPEAELTHDLFGPVLYEARIPALVAEGTLAPYAEFAWVVEPTREESDWLAGQDVRFRELTSDLLDPAFGSTSLPVWLRQRFVEPVEAGASTWAELAARDPGLGDAVLRLARQDLLPLPPGAALRERHRDEPDAEDWRLLVDDWLRGCIVPSSAGGGPHAASDTEVLESVRRALPSIGLVWTRHGVRAGRGTVDRVTARSRAKELGAAQVVSGELANLGERARVVVLCDHERATSTTSRRAVDDGGGAPPPQPAGSAVGVLDTLVADPVTAELDPVLVTGRTVAGSPATLERFLAWLAETHPMLSGTMQLLPGVEGVQTSGLARLEGRWTSGQWVARLTEWFTEGGTQCLVGTRGLLGEGWDAPCVTTLVDLTTVTTSTAVVQTRGRALRLDPAHPEKVAQVWSVVCVDDGHVAGSGDWARFARKHRGYFTVDERGEVVDGLAGIDSTFSDFHPPPTGEFDAIGARMLRRAEDRDAVRGAWDAGSRRDTVGHVLRVVANRTDRATTAPVPGRPWAEQRRTRPGAWWATAPAALALALVLLLAVLGPPTWLLVVAGVLLGVAAAAAGLALWGRSALRAAAEHEVTLPLVAAAVADGLHTAGLSPVGAVGVVSDVAPDGRLSFRLDVDDEVASARFAAALEEVVSPMASPRYVVARWVTSPPRGVEGVRRGWRDRGRQRPDGEVWHTVPSVLADQRGRADALATAWQHWVGGGGAVYAHGPEGAGVLATHRGADPFDVTCVVRRVWG